MGEISTEQSARKKIKNSGGLFIKIYPFGIVGFPDRLLLIPKGKLVFIEMKSVGKSPTKIQQWYHTLLRRMGFRVEVCYTVQQVMEVFYNEL